MTSTHPDETGQTQLTSGIVFVATGARFIACAEAAALSVKRHMPNVPIALFTDAPQLGITVNDVFDRVIALETVHHRSMVD